MQKENNSTENYLQRVTEIVFPLVLLLFPLLKIGQGVDLTDTPYSLGNYRFFAETEGVGSPAQKYIERISLVFVLNKLSIRFIMFVFLRAHALYFLNEVVKFSHVFQGGRYFKATVQIYACKLRMEECFYFFESVGTDAAA